LFAGTAKHNNDLAGSKQLVYKTCTGRGVKWVGIAYNDIKHSDAMDAVTVICKSSKRGEYIVPNSDFGERALKKIKCNYDEKVVGIAYKDREGKDSADGASVICMDRTKSTRIAYNEDLLGGRMYVTIQAGPREKPIGLAYADRAYGNDDVDGLTLVVK